MPTAGATHIDQYLTNFSRRISNETFIAEQVCTVVPVRKDSDKYATYSNDHLRAVHDERAPGSPPNEVDYGVGSDTYSLVEHTLRDSVPDEHVGNYDQPFMPFEDAVVGLQERIRIRLEKKVADLVFGTSTWTNRETLSGTDQLDDYANSDPFTVIEDAKSSVLSKSLRKPNIIVVGHQVFQKLVNHPDVVDRVKYTSSASITPEILARLFDVERVLVGSAVENTGKEGGDDNLAYIWGKHIFVGYRVPRPSLRTVTAVSMFRNRDFPRVERYRHHDEGAKATWVSYGDKFDVRKVADGAGFLIINAVS
mgnify:CR=1 FL=1